MQDKLLEVIDYLKDTPDFAEIESKKKYSNIENKFALKSGLLLARIDSAVDILEEIIKK